MSYRRVAALAVSALLLAGCGAAAGGAPPAPAAAGSQAAAGAAKPPVAASKPHGSTPAPGPHARRLHAPKEVTLADNGAIVDLSVGDAFTLRLPAPKGWHWRVRAFSTAVLSKDPGPAGTLGVFHALKGGVTLLTAEEVPPCGNSCPHGATGPAFGVAVRVGP